jgi:hypothetical protein
MTDIIFRESTPPPVEQPKVAIPDPEPNKTEVGSGEDDREPVELRDTGGRSVVLDALNITEEINSLPEADKENIKEVKDYVLGIVKSKGLTPTVSAFKKTLDGLKGEMGLDKEADPAVVLDRISGVVKAWRNLSFIKDPEEKSKVLFKLATLKTSKEMNQAVYKIMNDYEVWQ